MLNLFVQHTSYALSINENYDHDVRTDMESILNHMVKEREPHYEHTMESPDDMPAHAKCSLFGVSLTIPITNGDSDNITMLLSQEITNFSSLTHHFIDIEAPDR